MAQSYETLRCDFMEKQGQEFIEKVKQHISMVKDVIANRELPREVADKAVHQANIFFSQPLPTISETTQPIQEDDENLPSVADMRDKISELEKDFSSFSANFSQEKKKSLRKYKKLVAEGKRKETDHLLSINTLEKKLSNLRLFIRRNYEAQKIKVEQVEENIVKDVPRVSDTPAQGSTEDKTAVCSTEKQKLPEEPKAVELTSLVPPPPSPSLDVKLEPIKRFAVKAPSDKSEICDLKACGSSFVVACGGKLNEYSLSSGKVMNCICQSTGYKLDFISSERIIVGMYPGMVFFQEKRKNPLNSRSKLYWEEIKSLKLNQYPDAIAAISSGSIAAAVGTDIKFYSRDDEKNLKSIELQKPVNDMISIHDNYLVVCDSESFLKIDIFTGVCVKEVPRAAFCSLSPWMNGAFFALDPKNETLYLFGPDLEKIYGKWALGNQLRAGDELLRVAVADDNNCVCITKFGFVFHFEITYRRLDFWDILT